ncbi:MAG: tRNA (adenosine(37)-N6)-dimethylallyltransferase MiaA [Patescibacteria group bacterium]
MSKSKNSSGGQNVSLVAIVGPTASGKSALAISLAKKYRGEIICADSRTIYKGLDIGTAKPSSLEQEGIPHYGLNLVEPDKNYSAADFQSYAKEKISEIQGRGNLPILVGGSGLYIDGVLYSYEFGGEADPILRAELEDLSIEELQKRIEEAGFEMPENDQNKRYLVRAIEQGGVNRNRHPLMKGAVVIGLNPGVEVLESRIRLRAKGMINNGVLEEARLLDEDYGWSSPGASGNIYRALRPYVEGSTETIEKCLEDIVNLDKQLAKRQLSWFKRNEDINWFSKPEDALAFIASLLASSA